MLVNLVEILNLADEKKFAVGAFNTPNLECIFAVINVAEKLNVPVIISHAQLHEEVAPLAKIGPVMVEAAKRAKAMVAKMDELGFGACTNTRACEMECPKHITVSHIARLNREFLSAKFKD